MENVSIKTSDRLSLDQIIEFCKNIQIKFGEPSQLQAEKRQYQRMLIDICRRCADRTCPEGCEVKKAYRTSL